MAEIYGLINICWKSFFNISPNPWSTKFWFVWLKNLWMYLFIEKIVRWKTILRDHRISNTMMFVPNAWLMSFTLLDQLIYLYLKSYRLMTCDILQLGRNCQMLSKSIRSVLEIRCGYTSKKYYVQTVYMN